MVELNYPHFKIKTTDALISAMEPIVDDLQERKTDVLKHCHVIARLLLARVVVRPFVVTTLRASDPRSCQIAVHIDVRSCAS